MLLSEILHAFDSQLSQEQTWAVCYTTTKVLSSRRRENLLKRKNIKYIINIETVEINSTGSVSLACEEEITTATRQKESEIIKSLGNMLCRCLDYGLDASMINAVNFEPDMAELIAGMVLQQFDEHDEGFDDEDQNFERLSGSSRTTRCFRSFDEISRFCEARLLRKNIESGGEHYRNVLRALYVESHELKVFLDHVTESLDQASESENHTLKPGAASTAQECVYEWARFWLQVMHELRRGVHLKKVSQTKVSPLEYEYTPFEIASEGAVSKKVVLKPNEQSGLPENARDIILDFILSRPLDLKLKDASLDKEDESTDIDDEEQVDYESDDHIRPPDHRKQLKVQTPLLSKIQNWDASLESLLSDDLNQNEAHIGYWKESIDTPVSIWNGDNDLKSRRNSADDIQFHDHRKRLRRRRSAELTFEDDTLSEKQNRDASGQTNLTNAKKRLAVSAMCLTDISLEEDPRAVGTSLSEMSKVRQAVVLAEVESLGGKTGKNLDVKYGRVCFSCQKTKFSIFHKSKQCEICRKKFCAKCTIKNVEIPDHLVNVNTELEHQESLGVTPVLSKSLGNLASVGADDSITPFPCKRQSLLQMGAKHTFGGKLVNLCKECKVFMDSIVTETKNTRWHIGNVIDI